jgi:hypothetical protein
LDELPKSDEKRNEPLSQRQAPKVIKKDIINLRSDNTLDFVIPARAGIHFKTPSASGMSPG